MALKQFDRRTNRRHRSWKPIEIEITDRMVRFLHLAAMSGGFLPTSHFWKWTYDTHVDLRRTQALLAQMYDAYLFNRQKEFEDLVRYDVESTNRNPYRNQSVHTIYEPGLQVLKDRGLHSDFFPSPHGPYEHQLFCNCIRSSFMIEARDLDISFWPQHFLMEWVKRNLRFSSDNWENDLIPDGLVAVLVEGTRYLLFIECDRGTEPLTSSETSRKTWENSVRYYSDLFDYGKVTEQLNFQAVPLLLNITTGPGRAQSMVELSKGRRDILTICLPQFGKKFQPQDPVNLLTMEWTRGNGKKFVFHRP